MNIYDLLSGMIEVKKYHSLSTLFVDKKREELDTETDKKLFDILKKISSMALKVTDDDATFVPLLVLEGQRTFGPQDLIEDDYALLSNVEFTKLPLNLRARVADVLWLQKTDYTAAVVAHKAYYELFELWYDEENYIKSLEMIRRAICISVQINSKDYSSQYCQTIYDRIIKIDGKDKNFLSISLIEIILKQSFGDLDKVIDVLNNSIAISADNPNKMERIHLIKAKCFNKMKNTEATIQTNIELAEYFIMYGEKILKEDKKGAMRAEIFFCEAIKILRNNGKKIEADNAHRRLTEIQKQIPDVMACYSIPFDARKIIENIKDNMEGLNFEECIIRISQIIPFYRKESYKKKILEEFSSSPFFYMFSKKTVNEMGRTVFMLPGLDISNPEKDEELLENHIHNKMLDDERTIGDMYLRFAFKYIIENFDVKNEDFGFLVNDNAIIPEGREEIISEAIKLAFEGNLYEALHILGPQVENIFRYIAKQVGAITITLENDGSSKEKTLSSVFDLPELKECYDNDILFFFKGLLNEQAGANIRNDIAHGIMSPQRSLSGECLFFVCAVVKLLIMYSRHCLEVLNSEKLQTCEALEKDAISPIKNS